MNYQDLYRDIAERTRGYIYIDASAIKGLGQWK